jgi:tetratricopeptide (TPR) repeat protein
MDSLITAAARALATGDPLGALKRVALRDDAPALALRGIAMAQLGDLLRAKALLRSAARAFSPKEAVARARCVVAEAEIALVSRDLGFPVKALDAARATLAAHGDPINAAHARSLAVRRLLLIGRLDEAEHALAELDPAPFPPALKAAHELVVAGIAMRRLRTKAARAALTRAGRAARDADIPALAAEVESLSLVLSTPAARLMARGDERLIRLDEVEALLASKALVVDACRHVVRDAGTVILLARRPVLFALARALGEAWPGDVPRGTLITRAFRAKHADESHRARLRVEIGRLRAALRTLAGVSATERGFALVPRRARRRRAGAAGRRAACGGARLPRRRRIVVELRPGACARGQPAHRAAGTRPACGSRQGAVVRARAGAPVDDPARARFHDNLVTPRSTAERLRSTIINRATVPREVVDSRLQRS